MTVQAYTAVETGSIYFRAPIIEDLDAIHALESASYPADEAATREKLEFRINEAPTAFLLMMEAAAAAGSDHILGYVCGTQTSSQELTHESMSHHEPGGALLCIHSVVVEQQQRRKGLATRLLRMYLQMVAGVHPELQEVRLICKEPLVPLYACVGFKLLGPSPVEHGADQWLEMALRVHPPAAQGF